VLSFLDTPKTVVGEGSVIMEDTERRAIAQIYRAVLPSGADVYSSATHASRLAGASMDTR